VPRKEHRALREGSLCAEQRQSDQASQFNHGNGVIAENRAKSQADCPAE
jgi:hypothetical protein